MTGLRLKKIANIKSGYIIEAFESFNKISAPLKRFCKDIRTYRHTFTVSNRLNEKICLDNSIHNFEKKMILCVYE